jgi:hypothetical protein
MSFVHQVAAVAAGVILAKFLMVLVRAAVAVLEERGVL